MGSASTHSLHSARIIQLKAGDDAAGIQHSSRTFDVMDTRAKN